LIKSKRRAIGLALISLILLTAGLAFWQPEYLLMLLERSGVLYSVDIEKKVVALTIDDGPCPEWTASILDVLRENEVHATFFLISSYIPGNETLVERIVSEGHELGNHHTYDQPSIRYSDSEFEEELLRAHERISQFSTVHWFRPGSGWYNDSMLATLDAHGYRAALASVYPFDVLIPFPKFAARYILWRTRPGSIILLHDQGNRGKRTAETLRIVLPQLIQNGYQFATLSELVAMTEE
jgi:peptidoglycan/xylan/chitin deacetylase (PgdA/CDA1 family)